MQISDQMVELSCAAITEKRGFQWPSAFDDEEQQIGRENMRAALEAAFAVQEPQMKVAEEIADTVLQWMVKYDLLDAGNEYRAADILAVLNDLAPFPNPKRVGKLKWVEHNTSYPAPTWDAQTPFGFYNIEEISASDSPAYEVRLHAHKLISAVDGLPEAKSAAQADYYARILSALEPQERDGWKDIETAPKDGSHFLVYRKHTPLPFVCRFDQDYGEFQNSGGDHVYHLLGWMPLPAPPHTEGE